MTAFDGIGSAVSVYFDSPGREIWIGLSDERSADEVEWEAQCLTIEQANELIEDLRDAIALRMAGN